MPELHFSRNANTHRRGGKLPGVASSVMCSVITQVHAVANGISELQDCFTEAWRCMRPAGTALRAAVLDFSRLFGLPLKCCSVRDPGCDTVARKVTTGTMCLLFHQDAKFDEDGNSPLTDTGGSQLT